MTESTTNVTFKVSFDGEEVCYEAGTPNPSAAVREHNVADLNDACSIHRHFHQEAIDELARGERKWLTLTHIDRSFWEVVSAWPQNED